MLAHHPIDDYHAEKFKLRAKCEMEIRNSTTSLRSVFNETPSGEKSAEGISYNSSMMRCARRKTLTEIPKTALEFSKIIKDCFAFNQYFK